MGMPRKTKKQKLHAKKRSFVQNEAKPEPVQQSVQDATPMAKPAYVITEPARVTPSVNIAKQDNKVKIDREGDKNTRQYFLQDFRKSVIVTAVILLLQVALYYAMSTGALNQYFS